MSMAQRIKPTSNRIGRIDNGIVAKTYPQPGIITPHFSGSLPVGQSFEGGEVGIGHGGGCHIGGRQRRNSLGQALNHGVVGASSFSGVDLYG